MEIISTKIRKANKEHVCGLCSGKILTGTQYQIQFNKVDEVYSFKSHLTCIQLAAKLYDDLDYGLTDEIFRECVNEEYDFLMELHHEDLFNYELFQYPPFQERLEFVCQKHRIT